MNRDPVGLIINGQALLTPQVGVGVYTLRLIRGLLRSDRAPEFRVLVPESAASAGIPAEVIHRVPSGRGLPHPLLSELAMSRRIVQIARREYPAALFHSPSAIWSWVRPRRTVVTLHDCIYRHFPLYLGRFWLREWLAGATERFAGRSDLVLTVSDCSARDLAQTAGIPPEKIRVLYNWVGPEFDAVNAAGVAERVREKLRLPRCFWLYLGGFDYRKNVERLIEAYGLASRAVSCPPLVLGGSIPVQTAPPHSNPVGAIQVTRLSSSQILLPGRIAAEDLPGLFAAAELVIYPSLCEGFGLPPAEAIAVGTPILVSNGSSLPEVVPRPECRFDPLSVESIAHHLRMAAVDSQQFLCPLRPEFRESFAINRYLALLEEATPS